MRNTHLLGTVPDSELPLGIPLIGAEVTAVGYGRA